MRTLQARKTFQPLPTEGFMVEHLNSPLSRLRALAKGEPRQPRLQSTDTPIKIPAVYSYVVATTDLDEEARLRQSGSGPNFQGGLITLATCKHQMRAALSVEEWPGAWIIGLSSSRLHEGKQWLFFVTQVERAFGSHAEAWRALPSAAREAKSAQRHFHGDLFEPLKTAQAEPLSPKSYRPPLPGHRHEKPEQWHRDVNHRSWNRPAALLVGDSQNSFLWTEPTLYYRGVMTQGYKKWPSLSDFIEQLKEAP